MKLRVISAGKPALPFARDGIAEYARRLGRQTKLEHVVVSAGAPEAVAKRQLKASEGSFRVALDERGKAWTTADLVKRIDGWEMDGRIKAVSFLIGAADGHTPGFRKDCDAVWALSPLTLQHEMALLVLLEQLYRAYTIKRGEPYHR